MDPTNKKRKNLIKSVKFHFLRGKNGQFLRFLQNFDGFYEILIVHKNFTLLDGSTQCLSPLILYLGLENPERPIYTMKLGNPYIFRIGYSWRWFCKKQIFFSPLKLPEWSLWKRTLFSTHNNRFVPFHKLWVVIQNMTQLQLRRCIFGRKVHFVIRF